MNSCDIFFHKQRQLQNNSNPEKFDCGFICFIFLNRKYFFFFFFLFLYFFIREYNFTPLRRTAARTAPSSRRASWSTSSTGGPWRGPTPRSTPGGRLTGSTSATWSSATSSTGSCRSTRRKWASSSRLPGWTRWGRRRSRALTVAVLLIWICF